MQVLTASRLAAWLPDLDEQVSEPKAEYVAPGSHITGGEAGSGHAKPIPWKQKWLIKINLQPLN